MTFELGRLDSSPFYTDTVTVTGWARGKLHLPSLADFLRSNDLSIPDGQPDLPNMSAVALGCFLERACDACMPRRSLRPRRKQVHWWSEDIAVLRLESIGAFRALKRSIRTNGVEGNREEYATYRLCKRSLRTAIKIAQEKSWQRLCSEVTRRLAGNRHGSAARGKELEIALSVYSQRNPTLTRRSYPSRNVVLPTSAHLH